MLKAGPHLFGRMGCCCPCSETCWWKRSIEQGTAALRQQIEHECGSASMWAAPGIAARLVYRHGARPAKPRRRSETQPPIDAT